MCIRDRAYRMVGSNGATDRPRPKCICTRAKTEEPGESSLRQRHYNATVNGPFEGKREKCNISDKPEVTDIVLRILDECCWKLNLVLVV